MTTSNSGTSLTPRGPERGGPEKVSLAAVSRLEGPLHVRRELLGLLAQLGAHEVVQDPREGPLRLDVHRVRDRGDLTLRLQAGRPPHVPVVRDPPATPR